jgi:hypothetical protein
MPKAAGKKTAATSVKKSTFDLRIFLDTAGAARKIKKFRRAETIYSQGDPAKGVNYIKKVLCNYQLSMRAAKKRLLHFWDPACQESTVKSALLRR